MNCRACGATGGPWCLCWLCEDCLDGAEPPAHYDYCLRVDESIKAREARAVDCAEGCMGGLVMSLDGWIPCSCQETLP